MTHPTHNPKPIRVLIADDSSVMRAALSRMIESETGLEVAGIAVDGVDTIGQIRALQPDVVTLDIEMPRSNGLETLTKIMAEMPRPVIMLSSLAREGARITMEALDLGAFDFIPKPGPESTGGIFEIRQDLIAKIKSAVQSPLCSSAHGQRKAPARVVPGLSGKMPFPPAVLAIGTSTGGPKALQEILAALPATLPTGILVVQHMPVGFTAQFAERLNHACPLSVRESRGEEAIEPGNVYIAPAGWHMTVGRAGTTHRTQLSKLPTGTLHTPSVDVLMHSIAGIYGNQGMGMILTGMGSDGALGMKAIRDAGGWTIGQDAESCTVYGMPRSAAEIGALSRVSPLSQMASEILAAFPRSPGARAPLAARGHGR